ncbi:MAG: bifunctional ADP-dependent NAD(P)H-hydrate dehydratase/NAD(P)H-hydrate epimerase, partial [Oscillospiraceae bacterium]|nr:bifunctional ADP-dependent NAD(P)H-hydrate dehydratase/NAD(P)H-hydrate epimerase [Oscillospiraceae bacterium]
MDARIITPELVRLPERRQDTHKGDYGRVLIVAGSVGYTGAAALAARAAVRSGAGLVFLTVPRDIYDIEAIKNDEAMVFPLSCRDGKITEAAPEEVFAPSGKYDC